MIPVKLTLRGLYSYRHTQTIDFTNLTNAGLFGLFGGVGSGKSTILEAITFALYGESERLDNARDSRNYNMMNLKSNDLHIDFEFRTGHDDHYRFVVTARRNSKRFDEVKPFERAAYQWQNNAWHPLPHTSAEEITGLSYNNFKRTIIIPQGKFQEFLQLSARDRTDMLKELFGLERFELSGKVTTLETKNNERLQHLRGQLQALCDITPEQIDALTQQHTALQNELKKITAEISLLQKQLQEFDKQKVLHQRRQSLAGELALLLEQETTITHLEQELKEYERIIFDFKTDYEQLKSSEATIERSHKELNETKSKLNETQSRLSEIKQQLDTLQPKYDKRDDLLRRADEMVKVIDIRNGELQKKDLLLRSANGKQALENKILELANLKAAQLKLKTQFDSTRTTMPDMALLAKVKEWFTIGKNLQSSITNTQKGINDVDASIRQIKSRSFERVTAVFGKTTEDEYGNYLTGIEAEKQHIAQQQAHRQEMRASLEVQHRLNGYATELQEGKPCPLCGSTHHPHIPDADDVSAQLLAIKNDSDVAEKRLKALTDLEKELAQHTATIQAHQKQLSELTSLSDDQQKQMVAHHELFMWPHYARDNEAAIDEAFKNATTIQTTLDTQTKELDELSRNIDKAEKEKEKFTLAIQEFEHKQVEFSARIATLSTQLTLVQLSDFKEQTIEALTSEIDQLRKQHNDLTALYQTTDKQHNELNQNLGSLSGQIQAIEKNLKITEAEHLQIRIRIETKLAQSGNLTLADIEKVLQKSINIPGTRERIDRWKNNVSTHRELIKQTELEIGDKSYDAPAHSFANEQHNELKHKAELINQQIGTAASQIQRMQSDLTKQTELRKELNELEIRAADLNELNKLFRGNGFVNYISTVYLQNLCAMGNERFFHLTRQRLSLELADDNSFMVRDYMNEGKLRSVKTLSGGQTFQASLSLALALADSIRHLSSGHENFFFLDEGFGTLDKDSLNIVFDTLKSLRKENRIVGVISHVEEMQQEIETYLMITNHEETGSLIKGSWQ